MIFLRFLLGTALAIVSSYTLAAAPSLDAPLPLLSIGDRGELVYSDDDFSFTPWRSDHSPGKVHIVQYFGGTMEASETFKPFTNLLQESLAPGSYHVTTIINLDAAMWGTSGFVLSELKKNKRKHPLATMVIDEEGSGVDAWGLGNDGTGLAIIDSQGKVKFFTTNALGAQEMADTLELVKSSIDG